MCWYLYLVITDPRGASSCYLMPTDVYYLWHEYDTETHCIAACSADFLNTPTL